MAELDHWHPVLLSSELGKRPAAVKLCGREIAVFRTAVGGLGAIVDACPHRGMRLSEGWVEGQRLVCPYHGWQWAPDGSGKSPGTPTARPCAEAFDAVERHGAIWLKRAGAPAAFPRLDVGGLHAMGATRRRAKAPLEVTLDNFIEIEHTPTVHFILGYPLDRMHEVETEVIATPATVRVRNVGPQKPMLRPLYTVVGAQPGDLFVDDWTTYFSPVHSVYDQYWLAPTTRAPRPELLRFAVFFVPVTESETDVVALAFARSAPLGRGGLNIGLKALLKLLVEIEVGRDVELLGKLADKRPDLKGRSLGRFDKALVLSRRRIESIYRGRRANTGEVEIES